MQGQAESMFPPYSSIPCFSTHTNHFSDLWLHGSILVSCSSLAQASSWARAHLSPGRSLFQVCLFF